jgi:hypothetical protein
LRTRDDDTRVRLADLALAFRLDIVSLPGPTMARMRGSIEAGQSADVGWRSAAHAKLTQAGSLR